MPVQLSAPAPPVALYVHVPFCVSLCPYCDFVVVAGSATRGPRARVDAYLAALHVELALRANVLDEAFGTARPAFETVYLGGGTPSLVAPDAIADILEHVASRFGIAGGAEVTIEANPGPDERGDARRIQAAGVTRLSIGAQSMDDGVLRLLGRRHKAADVRAAFAAARSAGFASVSLDLLYDVPGDSVDSWAASLDAALALQPDHLSLYALTLDDPDAEGLTGPLGDHLPTTAGARRWRDRARARQDDDVAATQYLHAVERLAADGWRGYEISNWARPGHESRHNLAYWERRPCEAVGPGAHAFDGQRRRWNAARLDGYVGTLKPADGTPGHLPPGGEELLDPATSTAETLILGLRLDRGIDARLAADAGHAGVFAWAEASGLIARTRDQRIVLTARGRLLSNELFARIV